MSGPAGKAPPGSASKPARSDKLKVAYIGMTGVVVAALISGVFLYFSQNGPKNEPTGNNRVTINVAPAVAPPAQPALKTFDAPVFHLPLGRCAIVFSEPKVLQEDREGCIDAQVSVEIYCTAESQSVGGSTVWDEIYYATDWGTTGYIPDYYVYTGTDNAVMPSCVR
jgi:hypothetical protein